MPEQCKLRHNDRHWRCAGSRSLRLQRDFSRSPPCAGSFLCDIPTYMRRLMLSCSDTGLTRSGTTRGLFIESVAKATNHHVGEIAALGLAYVLIRLAEGYGLWQGKHWAEWVAVISAGIYLPLEFQHFAHHANVLNAGVIFFNIVIVLYLAKLLIRQRAERARGLTLKL